MKELTLAATVENIETVTEFVNAQLELLDCPIKAQMQIDIAIDELFGNIAHYAYNTEVGSATVRVEVSARCHQRLHLQPLLSPKNQTRDSMLAKA